MENNNNSLSFWKRPEGKVGKGILLGIAGIAGFAVYSWVLPFVLAAAWGTVELAIAAGVLYTMYLLVTSERVKTLVFYAFQMLSRWITGMFVDIDPIAILKAFARQMRKKREEVANSVKRIMGVKRTLQQEIQRSESEMTQALRLAEEAEKAGDEENLNVQAEKAGRRQSNIDEYRKMFGVVTEIEDALMRVLKRVDYHIANSEDEMQELIRKSEITSATRDATNSASAVLGDTDMLAVRNEAADRIKAKYSSALGELDGLIQMSRDLDSEIDLTKMSFRSDGKAKLADLKKRLTKIDAAPAKQLGAGTPEFLPPKAGADKWARTLRRPNNNN